MAEGLDSHTKEVMDENQALRNEVVAADSQVRAAEGELAAAQDDLETARDQEAHRGGTGDVTAAAEVGVYAKTKKFERATETQDSNLSVAKMAADDNLDVLSTQAKAEMDADFASRQSVGESPDTPA